MERKEPVMAPSVTALEDRIPLTWREVNELASVSAREEPAIEPTEAPAPVVASDRPLTEEEVAALCDYLTPVLEKAVRETLSQTLEMSLHNALMRVRSDLDRSIQGMVRQALEQELRAENLSAVLARKPGAQE